MAPGRRRGAKGLKSRDELRLGDLVLAKVKGFPAWPAKISRPEDWEKTPDPKKYFVYFFGTSEIAFVAPADIQAFTVEAKIKLSTRCKGKPLRFTQAVKEICEEFEKFQQKKLNGFEDDTSRDVLGSEDCSIDADEDDDVMKVGMKDGNSLNKLHRKMGTRSLDGSISPLEPCSHRRGIIDRKERKPCTSGNINDCVSAGIYPKQGTCKPDGPISLKKEVVSPSSSCSDYLSKEENSRSMKVEADVASVVEPNVPFHTKQEGGISPSIQLNYVRHTDSEQRELIKGNKLSQLLETKKSSQGVATFSERKVKKFMKKQNDDFRNNADEYKDLNKAELSRKKINVQQRQLKQTSRNNEVSHTAKKSNSSDIPDATANASTQTNKRVESNSLKDGKASLWKGKTESHSTIGVVEFLEEDEDVLPPSKRLCRAVEITEERVRKNTAASKVEASSVDNVKSPFSVGTKRRAVRLCDDEEEEKPKTPVHAGSAKVSRVTDTSKNGALKGKSTAVQVVKKTLGVEDGSVKEFSSAERPVEHASSNPQKNVEKKLKKTGGKSDPLSPKRLVPEKAYVKDGKLTLSSPKVSPEFVAASRPIPGIEKPSKVDTTKPPHCNSQKKPPTSQDIVSGVGESSSTSLNKQMGERSKLNSISERKKAIPKSSSHGTDVLEFGGLSGNGSVPGERLLSRTDKTISLDDSKISDPVTSMKHLIAAAQAKKREAHLQNLNSNAFFPMATHAEAARSSPSSISPILPLGFSSILRPDAQGLQAHSVSPSSSSDVQRLSTTIQHEIEQCEDKKIESGNCVTESSLSGGTEAAVARDAFEGMIETLSRTKESIGRATRLAIDCAKYGIASEVIELLIRKLQSESSMHRKVDLFFLVDSITQCSNNHKGIAGASYIPIVQAALSRLLGAAAPPGAAACENRRQCLKVLRLWQERQILPEAFLKPFMDEIGVTNDETSSGLSLRRPSRVQRAFDDPIREMEGMLVDEYGSNATFQLAGFLSTHAFDDNDDDDDEIMPTIFYNELTERSPGEHTPVSIDAENQSVTPNERRHCILEDVDGELEMEDVSVPFKDEMEDVPVSLEDEMQDVSVPLKDERQSYVCATTEVAASDTYLEMSSNNSELPPLPEGSPPLPPNSPPQTPPLPFSPRPVLPQLPPAVPLPPQFPSQANPFPLPPVSLPSGLLSQQPLVAQPSSAPQCFQPFPPSISSSPSMYQHQPSTNEISLPANGNQLTQIVATAQGLHADLPGRNDVYGQFRFVPSEAGNPREPSLCNTSRPIEYIQIDAYGNPRSSQPSQQFQLPFTQTPLHPNAATQNQPNHLGYGNASAQPLYPQHPYPHSFSMPNLPDAPKLYVVDDQWRPRPVEFNNDHQSSSWMAGGRSSLGAPFAHEGQ
ncbi:transcription cofactor [Lithospermum erythrorhizon]|uniref:Transcription cofactor n=1 Tax=Lithospermum erythrorhizon TaxID=34254 RepID=A0AAV3QW75_LITER